MTEFLGISDDDLCANCSNLLYCPGDLSSCTFGFPGEFDEDGYCVDCKHFDKCNPGENWAVKSNPLEQKGE